MTTQNPHVVVLGGGYAGLAAATKLRQLAPHTPITLIDSKPTFFERIRLHEVACGSTARQWSYSAALAPRQIRFIQGTAMRLDLTRRQVVLSSHPVEYTHLIYALGSQARTLEGTASLSSLAAATALHHRLRGGSGRLVVVGAGLTGIELAGEIAERVSGWRVTLVSAAALTPSCEPGGYAPAAIDAMRQFFNTHRVELIEGRRVRSIEKGQLTFEGGQTLPSDLCVWANGFSVPQLAAQAGLEVNAWGQVVTDASLRSVNHPEVVAVGDAADVPLRQGRSCRMGCATGLAMSMTGARAIAAVLSGQEPPSFEFSYLFRNVSLGRNEGFIQFVDRDDRPRRTVWVGPRAVKWKEYISHGTLSTCGLERGQRMPALPPLVLLPQVLRALNQYA